jgi:hypothetical protein
MAKNEKEYKVSADKIVEIVKKTIQEGNARRIIIKNEKQETIMEFPVTIGAIGIVLAPILAAVGALAAILTNCTVIVKKRKNVK